MPVKWYPDEFKRKLRSDLVENAEIVGKFVSTDARQRLVAIRDPKWGANYRTKLVARLLTYEVEEKGKDVVIYIGVQKSKSGNYHGYYIELGSKTAPAHPFLRPAVFMNKGKIISLLAGR